MLSSLMRLRNYLPFFGWISLFIYYLWDFFFVGNYTTCPKIWRFSDGKISDHFRLLAFTRKEKIRPKVKGGGKKLVPQLVICFDSKFKILFTHSTFDFAIC
uniref:Uncharacterized protein n=1 Tax=Cacopsylla melanoneura TaxID=428564 RepID=A0A8D8XPC0_9HEMI